MPEIEQLELAANRAELETDVMQLVDKYFAVAEWDVPGIDEPLANRLILAAIRQALGSIEQALPGASTP